MPEFLTVAEVASTLRMLPNSVLTGLRRGTLPVAHVKVGKSVLIPRTAFEALLANSVVAS